jgi:hypothetical protein
LKNRTIIITLINIIVDAISVDTTYKSMFFVSFLLACVIDAVTAVDDISHHIAQDAIILHFSPTTFDIT